MEIYERRTEVQELFPDPLGADRRSFAYWFVVYGRRLESLHPDLIRPVRESLPLKTRVGLTIRRVPLDGRPGLGLAAILSRPSRIRFEEPECHGVNLVGCFHGALGAASFAPTIRELLDRAGVPLATIERDRALPDLMTSDLIRHPQGAPFPTTLLVLPSNEWKAAVESLPLTSRAGGRVVGFVTESVSSLNPAATAVVDELWSPSEQAAARLQERTGLTTRVLPLGPPRWAEEKDEVSSLDQGRRWFGVSADVPGSKGSQGVSVLLECLRRMKPEIRSKIGVCLVSGAGSAHLQTELDHLPVHVLPVPARSGVLLGAIARCDAWVNFEPTSPLMPIHVTAAGLGKQVVGLPPGGLTEVWNGQWMVSPSENLIESGTKLLTRLAQAGDTAMNDADVELTSIVDENGATAAWVGVLRNGG